MNQRPAVRWHQEASETSGLFSPHLSRRDFSVVAKTIVFLPAVQLALRFAGFQRTARLVGRVVESGRKLPRPISALEIERSAQVVRACCRRWPFRATCLDRSLVTALILGLHKVPLVICLGFRKCNTRLEGHAWLEYNDLPIAETPDVAELSRLEFYATALQGEKRRCDR
jgi:hypothetical protein